MDETKGMRLRQEPSWVLEQIEMGLRQVDPIPPEVPAVPRLSFGGIESAVTRTLQEELARLDERDSK